jgi:hypothetical protein
MKKIITLVLGLGIISATYAQGKGWQQSRNNTYTYNEGGHFNKGYLAPHDRQFQTERINREFIFKIRAIKNDYSLSRHQKKVAIRIAERQRTRQLKMLNKRSYGREHHRWEY